MNKRRSKRKGRHVRRLAGAVMLLAVLASLYTPLSADDALPVSPLETLPAVALEPRREPDVPLAAEAPVDPVSPVVPEEEPVEDGYFAAAVFLGDSRTEGFQLYSGLKEGTYLYAVGATVESVFTKPVWETEGEKVPLLDALAELPCERVYVMLGINELGWPQAEKFKEQYGLIVERIRQDHPNAEVVLQSLLPVSPRQEEKGTYVNNARIAVYNALLLELAAEKNCPFLDVKTAVTGEDDCLREELTVDGVHLNTEGCKLWLEYLRTHPIPEMK